MSDDKENEHKGGFFDMALIIALRLIDSGLAPWVAVATFFLCALAITVFKLESKDELALLLRIGTLHGFAWLGWVVAFAEIPILKWCLKREKTMSINRLSRLQTENQKARELLKKLKQDELKLEQEDK